MRADLMTWMQRLIAMVFVIGIAAILGAGAILVQRGEGVAPLPVLVTIIGLVALVLVASACLSLASIAMSARQGGEALRTMARSQAGPAARAPGGGSPPFSDTGIARQDGNPAAAANIGSPSRPERPRSRSLIAER